MWDWEVTEYYFHLQNFLLGPLDIPHDKQHNCIFSTYLHLKFFLSARAFRKLGTASILGTAQWRRGILWKGILENNLLLRWRKSPELWFLIAHTGLWLPRSLLKAFTCRRQIYVPEMNKRKSWILKELCMYTKVNFDGTKPVFRCLIIIFQSCLEGR